MPGAPEPGSDPPGLQLTPDTQPPPPPGVLPPLSGGGGGPIGQAMASRYLPYAMRKRLMLGGQPQGQNPSALQFQGAPQPVPDGIQGNMVEQYKAMFGRGGG